METQGFWRFMGVGSRPPLSCGNVTFFPSQSRASVARPKGIAHEIRPRCRPGAGAFRPARICAGARPLCNKAPAQHHHLCRRRPALWQRGAGQHAQPHPGQDRRRGLHQLAFAVSDGDDGERIRHRHRALHRRHRQFRQHAVDRPADDQPEGLAGRLPGGRHGAGRDEPEVRRQLSQRDHADRGGAGAGLQHRHHRQGRPCPHPGFHRGRRWQPDADH